jgi:hypothetical protein
MGRVAIGDCYAMLPFQSNFFREFASLLTRVHSEHVQIHPASGNMGISHSGEFVLPPIPRSVISQQKCKQSIMECTMSFLSLGLELTCSPPGRRKP